MSINQIGDALDLKKGVQKTIHEGSKELMFEVLQSTQYSTPIRSTVRELVTNAWDSQREKEFATEILKGEKKMEDYYIEREGVQYEDSKFDPSYYDLAHLDLDKNQVELRYTRNVGTGFCDLVEIIDFGVGLGGRRLEGVLQLGFSTKRNTKEGFGAFGLGAKVALSTEVPFYTIDTIYNGQHFRCDCYMNKTLFTIPKFNAKGELNPTMELSGNRIAYEKTEEKNRTIISFGVKRHNRSLYKDAIKEQLIYVDNVLFTEIDNEDEEGPQVLSSEEVKAKVLYVSDNLILSEGTIYNKPHIVIVKDVKDSTGINYGYVDFKELELEDIQGSVGFKCPIRQVYRNADGEEVVISDGVAVTPSREKVIWNEHTKNYILKVIAAATEEASALVSGQLKDKKDLFEWLQACKETFSRNASGTLFGRLSQIVNQQNIRPSFPGDPRLKFGSLSMMFPMLTFDRVSVTQTGTAARSEVTNLDVLEDFRNVFIKDTVYSPYRDKFMWAKLGNRSFFTVRMADEESQELKGLEAARRDKVLSIAKGVWSIFESHSRIRLYSDIVVPKEVEDKFKQADENAALSSLSPSELRKLNEAEVVMVPVLRGGWIRDKREPKAKTLLYTQNEVYYTNQDEWNVLTEAAAYATPNLPSRYSTEKFYYTDEGHGEVLERLKAEWEVTGETPPQFAQIRQELSNKLPESSGLRHVSNMYYTRDVDGSYKAHPYFVGAYTAKLLTYSWNEDLKFLEHFKNIDFEIFSKYMKLKDFMHKYKQNPIFFHTTGPLTDTLEKLWDFQQFCVKVGTTEEEIKWKSFESFGLTDVTGAQAVDFDHYDIFVELTEYVLEIKHILLYVSSTAWGDKNLEIEVRKLLIASDRGTWAWTPDRKIVSLDTQ